MVLSISDITAVKPTTGLSSSSNWNGCTALLSPSMHSGCSGVDRSRRSEEHTSELQSLMRISFAVFCLKKKMDKYNRLSVTSILHSFIAPQVHNEDTTLIHLTFMQHTYT